MKTFTVVLEMPFTKEEFGDGLVFTRFLPREKEALEVVDGNYRIFIYFSYHRKCINEVANDFINRQHEIKRHNSIATNSLIFKINTSISTQLYNDLGNEILNESTEQFCKEIINIAIRHYEKIFDFARNVKRQYWLLHIDYYPDNFVDFLVKANAVWEFNGTLKRLYLKGHVPTITVSIDTELDAGFISKRYWIELGEFLNKESKSKTEQVFLSNGFFYLAHYQTRMAIIEAVIALEHTTKKNSCELIKDFIPEGEFKYIKKLFLKKNEFSIPFGLTIEKMRTILEKEKISADDLLHAIEYRNMIMHNSQKEIEYKAVRACLLNIEKYIKLISTKNT